MCEYTVSKCKQAPLIAKTCGKNRSHHNQILKMSPLHHREVQAIKLEKNIYPTTCMASYKGHNILWLFTTWCSINQSEHDFCNGLL